MGTIGKKVRARGVAFCCLVLAGLLAGCDAQEAAVSSMPAIVAPSSAPTSSSVEPEPDKFDKEIDFDDLLAQNPDYVAWLVVPGSVIDYPIMYCADNTYYLNHDENRNVIQSGAIFIDMSNARDFTDPVTVAYGHFMPDDSYFTQLHNYKDEAYFHENREVLLYTPNGNMEYEVVAAFLTDNRNVLYGYDYRNTDDMQTLIDWIKEQRSLESVIEMDDVTTDDKLFIMSTCVQEVGGDGRLLVVARLLEKDA